MDILKAIKRTILVILVLFLVTRISAQSGSGNITDLQSAFKESYAFEANGLYGSAIDVLVKVYDAGSYEINLRLGWLQYLNKQYQESVDYYNKAINLMPYSVEAKLGLANPLAVLEDWTKLEELYKSILTIDPNNSQVNYRLGTIYYYRPDYPSAFKHFEKVVNMYPFDFSSVNMLAWTNFQLGKTREAEILFNKSLLISPDHPSSLAGLKALKK